MTCPFSLLEARFTIGVRYCGGCKPQIDRSRIVMDLREGSPKMGLKVDLTIEMVNDQYVEKGDRVK
jgi:hypothetical protein